MTSTVWDFRNRLLAILNAAKHNGEAYIDVESSNIRSELGDDERSDLRIPLCHDIMTRMMRPGDCILKETTNANSATMLIRYVLKAKEDNQHGASGS